ncbi:hypothetical protein AO825_08460 [Pectobacterium brasiliense]|uniref:hypothetical protein n=1 Tax=Pectobacterium brasiliense TaxID=180957 RepID=UPI0001A444C9|nr:hypothetical protein [Pectobacterium brasiliense]KGA24941.1 hypothetical protein KS44_06455 [Pectobacterium brasiliense]KRF62883.1 hypothetical protein AO825_08460 [Pectobacterium brasiliense]MBN3186095.1 hypothetical protein [Pectobacterium brasiliense]QHG26925.1 hypothetical protein GT391_02010 [Pectobacterium brasiliense]
MSKGVEQLTAMINHDGVRQQRLIDCIFEAKTNKRQKCTEITFGTKCADVVDACNAQKMVGLILWIPRDVFDKCTKGEVQHDQQTD